jgi:hypothetical protein
MTMASAPIYPPPAVAEAVSTGTAVVHVHPTSRPHWLPAARLAHLEVGPPDREVSRPLVWLPIVEDILVPIGRAIIGPLDQWHRDGNRKGEDYLVFEFEVATAPNAPRGAA